MKDFRVKLMFIGLLAAIALAWGVANYVPSIIEAQQQCVSPRVIDDMSKELMICYENIDRCNKYFEACVNTYLGLDPKEVVP